MPIITKIETQKNKSRVNIFVDDSFFCGLNKETAVLFGLKENKEIDEEQLTSAVKQSEIKSAFEKSLDYISRRMHTKKELTDKLIKKGYSKEVVLEAIKKLEDYHYIDDELFAKQFAQANQKLSQKVLKGKLAQKGVSSDIVLEIISDRTPENEFELCLAQAKKYVKSKPINEYKDLQKMQASLARKGFDFDTIKKVSKKVTAVEDESEY